ncbi:hypothetical protein Tco_0954925 [Tanacetum coccineum]|uniref:Uncharacterized protein n=1 Tax=Tanacetum coccineum TaxID=301880 RepID=A0ABQ5E5S7_9ASTR
MEKPKSTKVKGNPFDVHWARKINGHDDLDWAPLKMNGQDDFGMLLTQQTHTSFCLSKETQSRRRQKSKKPRLKGEGTVAREVGKEMYSNGMFDRAFKRVNTFEDFRTELVEGKEKRAGTELIQEITKKQKVEDDKETAELKQLMKIIPDEEEVAIDAIPLAIKSPSIIGWKIYKE